MCERFVSLSASTGIAVLLGATELRQGYCRHAQTFLIEEPDGTCWWWPSLMEGSGPSSSREQFDIVNALSTGLYPHNIIPEQKPPPT